MPYSSRTDHDSVRWRPILIPSILHHPYPVYFATLHSPTTHQIASISLKFDGKGKEPVKEADMPMLAKYVAYMKELPSQAMFVDFHLDNKFRYRVHSYA